MHFINKMVTPCDHASKMEDLSTEVIAAATDRALGIRRNPQGLALQRAQIIQQRQKLEAVILDNIITLSHYPRIRTPPHSPSNPAAPDVAEFKELVRPFQPSDYDDLITERNANGLCGYVLCSRPKLAATQGGPWKLLSRDGNAVDIVWRKEHEQWCSQSCAKHALYIKVQLNETAAWERVGIPDIDIELFGEARNVSESGRGDRREKEIDPKATSAALLANECGNSKDGTTFPVTLRPKEVTMAPEDINDVGEDNEEAHLRLEGYKPTTHMRVQ